MGFDLISRDSKEDFRFNIHSWPRVLNLAYEYGWKPAGTEITMNIYDLDGKSFKKSQREWSGSYMFNDYQEVTKEDASNLAAALQMALVDIPDERITHRWDTENILVVEGEDNLIKSLTHAYCELPHERVLNPKAKEEETCNELDKIELLTYFSGKIWKCKIGEFVQFCQKSAFVIG
jgi:hypothetical protein